MESHALSKSLIEAFEEHPTITAHVDTEIKYGKYKPFKNEWNFTKSQIQTKFIALPITSAGDIYVHIKMAFILSYVKQSVANG